MEDGLKKLLARKRIKSNYKYCIICDIDNVVIDSRKWVINPPKKTRNRPWSVVRAAWDKIHSNMLRDCKPNRHMINLLLTVIPILPVVFITGREDRNNVRENTMKQLKVYSKGIFEFGQNYFIYFREEGDYRPAHEMKEDIVKYLIEDTELVPLLAIDDEIDNCEMYSRNNIPYYLYDIESKRLIGENEND